MDGATPCGVDEQSTRHTSTPKGRFVLRADSIRPYNRGGRAAGGAKPWGHTNEVHPLSFAFAQQLPQRWSQGGFEPPLRVRWKTWGVPLNFHYKIAMAHRPASSLRLMQ